MFSFQRTQRVPKEARHPLASNPPEFARVLTEKLEKVKLEQELHEREARNLSAHFEVCIVLLSLNCRQHVNISSFEPNYPLPMQGFSGIMNQTEQKQITARHLTG